MYSNNKQIVLGCLGKELHSSEVISVISFTMMINVVSGAMHAAANTTGRVVRQVILRQAGSVLQKEKVVLRKRDEGDVIGGSIQTKH